MRAVQKSNGSIVVAVPNIECCSKHSCDSVCSLAHFLREHCPRFPPNSRNCRAGHQCIQNVRIFPRYEFRQALYGGQGEATFNALDKFHSSNALPPPKAHQLGDTLWSRWKQRRSAL